MSDRDYYEVLGLDRGADLGAIKKAYRRSAVENHPDRNPGDAAAEERFKEAAEAYSVLSNPEKRAVYDRFGKRGFQGQTGFSGFDQDIFGDFSDILGDLFGLGSIFGGTRRGRRGHAGSDLRYDLEIDFEEAVHGMETRIRVPRLENCPSCNGSGGETAACESCGGRGQVAFQQGFFTIARSCPQCNGAGRRITDPCDECHGRGRLQAERTLTVRIPPGVDDGMRLRMAGEGEAGAGGGRRGDLYVVLQVREHAVFTRDGHDIHCRATISFAQAALGVDLDVPTIDGEMSLAVPTGCQSGTRFRLRGRGVPDLEGRGRGDQLVTVQVRTPERLNDEQRDLLEKLAELDGDETAEPGLFDRVRNIFG